MLLYLSNLIQEIIAWLFALVGLPEAGIPFVSVFIKAVLIILVIMMCVAYLTWLERKIHGLVALRKGPNVVGPLGLLQPLFDGFKLLLKEMIIPANANKAVFVLAPVITFLVALLGWVIIPVEAGVVFADLNVGVLYLLATSSLAVYGIIMAGWASNSQYAFLGAIRSSSQMISYEIAMGVVIVCVVLLTGSLNMSKIVLAQQDLWYFIKLFPMAILFFIIIVAETNRHPFDLPEAESDIVSGYHTEYSGFIFALFFLAEYANMILMSSFFTILFLGGWLPLFDVAPLNMIPSFFWFVLKVVVCLWLMIQLRSILPRYRYDQLMRLGWKVFIPLSLLFFVCLAVFLKIINYIPTSY
ncbi:MAG: NADH-quinone oxidoreductase subunit NuoH [Alphaproteobacteria bacterium]|jgi:NADH-quinone oxidoreductase subunit H|nr:NADH-quinone oxidoreductase subunit NuoH [Alphaproteobacteria bacterium]